VVQPGPIPRSMMNPRISPLLLSVLAVLSFSTSAALAIVAPSSSAPVAASPNANSWR
jgi:hypothetical protein